jgi:hypothetical protein
VIVIERHSEPSVRKDLINDAFNGEQFLLCHSQSPTIWRIAAPSSERDKGLFGCFVTESEALNTSLSRG